MRRRACWASRAASSIHTGLRNWQNLQEQGRLQTFYHAFVEGYEEDPTGTETLKSVLGVKDLAAFQARGEREVLTLPDP
ncbi:hypothetical protein [Sorangium sp. So ce426]|uniref:hypothetical protein n=1 Tax=Sorangium sp. So ce426 TaxID=3133312 RepID=UPI003F5B3510